MNDWVNLAALWRIVVVGLICGAGLPALFAVGLKALALAEGDTTTTSGGTAAASRGNPALLAAAGLCFAVVLAAIGWGIYLIVAGT